MVWLIHFAYDVPLSFIEGKGYTGGYTLLTFNTTRLCQSLVGRHCLAIKNPDVGFKTCYNTTVVNHIVIDMLLEVVVYMPMSCGS